MGEGSASSLRIYIAALCGGLALILAGTVASGQSFGQDVGYWAMLTALLAVTEYADLSFHDQGARFGLSASEAILLPMLIGLEFGQVVWGTTAAIAAVRLLRYRGGLTRGLFNVAQYGCSAAAAAGVFGWLAMGSERFSPTTAAAAALGVTVFAVLTHLLTASVISLAEHRPFRDLSRSVAPTTLPMFAINVALGLLFAASYSSAPWTLVLFSFPLVGLFVGIRALLRQQGERERVEKLHEASRALAVSPDLEFALDGFLRGVCSIVAARSVCAIVMVEGEYRWSGLRDGLTTAALDPVCDDALVGMLVNIQAAGGPVIVREAEAGERAHLPSGLGARSLVAVPISVGYEITGCLVALDRIGVDEFDQPDALLLEALASELAVTLDSYRLFAMVAGERERFSRIFYSSQEGVCLLDGGGIVRAWNPALERMTGYSENDVLGYVWSERIFVRTAAEKRLTNLDLVHVPAEQELELVPRDGPARWVTVLSGPVSAPDGGGWVLLVRDVTSQRAVEQAKADFLATVSHELRTPLTTIKGSLQVLTKTDEAEVRGQMFAVLQRGADRLERLILNLLIVSRLESGRALSAGQLVPLNEIIAERVETTLDGHPRLEVRMSHEPLLVLGDRELLSHTIDHLLDNARKFGGPAAMISVVCERRGNQAHLSVVDEGPGIASADRLRIFDRFVRLGDTLTRETQGAGVGLFIAKQAIEAMEGSIWVEGVTGSGSAFHVSIPLQDPSLRG